MNLFYKQYKKTKGIIFFSVLKIKRFLRKILGMDLYYVIGDSHSQNFIHDSFVINHIGPATAYKLSFEKSTTNSRRKIFEILDKIYKNKQIKVIFVFGEIDVRLHIYSVSKEKHLALNKVILNTVKSYMIFVDLVKKRYPLIRIYIFNILPQGEQENIYGFKHYADLKTRQEIVLEMNRLLKKESKAHRVNFIDIFHELINYNGERKKEYVFDEVHYNRKIMKYILSSLKDK
jgi:hypothetical protein